MTLDSLIDRPSRIDPARLPQNEFVALGLSTPVVAELQRRSIDKPFPIQSLCIPDALAGRDICGKARTGSGKTLAFGLPMVERARKSPPRTPDSLVLVPTRELASQVAAAIEPLAAVRRLRVAAIYGGVSLQRQAQALARGVDIVIATPGRLNDLLERGDLTVAGIRFVVLDEADQMADMGFMPQVERILRQLTSNHQTLLFSATLDGEVDRLVKRYQDHPVFHAVDERPINSTDMHHRFIAVHEDDRIGIAADIAAGPGRTLFFVRTQRGADRLARRLAAEGVAATAIHGRLSQPQRERALRNFTSGATRVLVATNIAARGIHVDGVDTVVHHDLPEDAKTYLHRSGRTARAGASGVVVTFVGRHEFREANLLRRQAGVREAVEPMRPGDARLANLAAWKPALSEPAGRHETDAPAGPQPRRRPQAGRAPGKQRSGRSAKATPAATLGTARRWRPAGREGTAQQGRTQSVGRR